MKTLFLSSMYLKPGGTYSGMAVHRQAVELQRRGVDVKVVCPVPRFATRGRRGWKRFGGRDGPGHLGPVELDGVAVTYLPFPNLPLGIAPGAHVTLLYHYLARCLSRLNRLFSFDVLHAHRVFPTGYVAMRLARRCGVPGVVSAVGSDVHTHPNRNRGIRRRTEATIAESDAVLAVSDALADQIYELANPRRSVQVVHMGVDTGRFSPSPSPQELRLRLNLPAEGVGICTVARLVTAKGMLELFEAFERLLAELPQIWLVVVGDGPLRDQLKSRIRSRGLNGRVFLAGSRPHEEVPDWLNAADLFVLPSYGEGLPNVVLEAMACARPVIATDVGGVAEAVQAGDSGILVPPCSVVPLVNALDRLIRSPELRRDMGIAGRKQVCSKFTWTRTAEQLQCVYRDVLSAHRNAEEQGRGSRAARRGSPGV